MIVLSVGCPASVGPEVAVAAVSRARGLHVLCGSRRAILASAEMLGVPRDRFVTYAGQTRSGGKICVHDTGPELGARDLSPQGTSRAAGRSQLAAIEAGYALARRHAAPLVTGPVSKARIARSGAPGAERFTGHTEWLQALDGAASAVMCFASRRLVTALATTHLPLARVPERLTAGAVAEASVQLGRFLLAAGHVKPELAVCSLNPHAGESELLGDEERLAIVPGIRQARRRLGAKAVVSGPIGAESAYRLALARRFQGVVAMYHDQATIPTKLVAFGEAVNVTLGLSIVRTSVDHGTAYDIAWQGVADPGGMRAALRLARQMSPPPPRRG